MYSEYFSDDSGNLFPQVSDGKVGDSSYSVPMDATVQTSTDTSPDILDSLKSTAKSILTAPGKIVSANIAEAGQGTGKALSNVTGPLIPIVALAGIAIVLGAYFYSKKGGVNILTASKGV